MHKPNEMAHTVALLTVFGCYQLSVSAGTKTI